jgi:4-hydroxy-3-methylbut-2-enyl diphosphate reductase
VDGETVHNRLVMQALEDANVKLFRDSDQRCIVPNDCIVTRAHGIPESRYSQLKGCFKNVTDGTCSHVAGVLQLIKHVSGEARDVVIVGNSEHPEVITLVDAARGGKCFVINSAEQVKSLPHDLTRVLLIAQSTIDGELFADVAKAIGEKYSDAEVKNTICGSSRVRQRAILDLAREGVEAIIVVGGKHSSNTTVLVKVARRTGLPVFHIEVAAELPLNELEKFCSIGVATGASTSEEMVREVVDSLREKCVGKRIPNA